MTMPDERTRAVVYAGEFLVSLLDPKKTPKVPNEIRVRAGRLLRHYPSSISFVIGPGQFAWSRDNKLPKRK